MEIKTKAALLALLRSQFGYDGDGTASHVKAFLKDNPEIELTEPDGKAFDVDKFYVKQKVTVGQPSRFGNPDVQAPEVSGEDEGDEAPPLRRKAATINAIIAKGSGRSSTDIAKKSYDTMAKHGKTAYASGDEAEVAGAWFRRAVAGPFDYNQKANDEEILGKALITTTNTAGGATVPEDFNPAIINLREQFGGLIGAVGRTERMRTDVQKFARTTGDHTVYAPGEATAITTSDMAFDNVTVTAVKMAVLTTASAEILNDNAVSVADVVTKNVVWSLLKKQEQIFVLGDGTSTYFGYTGLTYKPRAVLEAGGGTWTTDSDKVKLGGWVSAAGNTFAEITMANLEEVAGRYPQYGYGAPKWVCSKPFYHTVMLRLLLAQGGSPAYEVVNGVRTDMFLGYPVVFSPAMSKVDANSQVPLIFGDIALGSICGEVAGSMSIASSDQRYFDQDLLAIRGIIRWGCSVHDVGNYHATAASREAGPICGLITLNS